MANRFFGEATIIADGKTYTLRCDFNAMCHFEEATGDALEAFDELEAGKFSVVAARQIMHSFLQEHHPDADVKLAGRLLSEDTSILQQVIKNASPEPEKGDAPGKRKAKPRVKKPA